MTADAPPSSHARALSWTALFAVMWALLEGAVGRQFQTPPHLLQVVWCRYAVHLLVTVAVWGWQPALRTARVPFHLARSLLMLVMPVTAVLALGRGMAPSTLWTVFWTAPLVILGLAAYQRGERVDRRRWATTLLMTLAAALVLEGGPLPTRSGLVITVLMMLSFAQYVVMTRGLRREPTPTNLFYTAFGVFAALTPALPWIWTWPTLHDGMVLAGIGLGGWVGLYALDRALHDAPAATIAPALLLQPAAATLLEPVHAATPAWLAGMGLLAVGAALTWRHRSD